MKNKEINAEKKKAIKALNRLHLLTMNIKDQKKSSKDIWEQITTLSTFIYLAKIGE